MATLAKDILFIHIPKTGGTSVSKWLLENVDAKALGWKHDGYNLFPTYSNYFTVVRNPYARILSWYYYMGKVTYKRINDDKWANWYNQNMIDIYESGFSKSLDSMPSEFYPDVCMKPQVDYFDSSAKFVLKTETLSQDFIQIQDWFQCYKPLPHKNKSISVNYRDAYTAKDKKIVKKYFEKDLDLLKYTF
jgi:hypothetical protein